MNPTKNLVWAKVLREGKLSSNTNPTKNLVWAKVLREGKLSSNTNPTKNLVWVKVLREGKLLEVNETVRDSLVSSDVVHSYFTFWVLKW
jgi:hypothetical protein